jgi:hypothetical protein
MTRESYYKNGGEISTVLGFYLLNLFKVRIGRASI